MQEWYKAFRDTKIDVTKLKNFISNKYDVSISDISSTILSTSMKIFIGELVEEAWRLKSWKKQQGPIELKYY